MVRLILASMAALALAGCETMPDFLAPPSSTTESTPAPSTPAPAPLVAAPTPEQQLLELERRLAANAQTQGLGAALAPALDPVDGFVIRPGVIYQGQDQVPAALGTAASGGPVFWQADRVYVSGGGDMGVTSGRYVQVVTGAEAIQGRYLVVWRRDAAGEWKALTETRVPDPARARTTTRRR
jgi:ketosteroid isomerase-like protein